MVENSVSGYLQIYHSICADLSCLGDYMRSVIVQKSFYLTFVYAEVCLYAGLS